jgi:AAA+ ATPase superfamily predicted ATPase
MFVGRKSELQALLSAYHSGRSELIPIYGRRRVGKSELILRRDVRFALEDPFLGWFRFVFPNTSFVQQMGARRAFRDRIRPGLDAYAGLCFERLCREALPALYRREGVSADFEIGEYWDRAVQIDIVGLRQDGWTDLGECKWGVVRSVAAVLEELRSKIADFPNRRGATIGRRVVVRQANARAIAIEKNGPIRLHTLEELYG